MARRNEIATTSGLNETGIFAHSGDESRRVGRIDPPRLLPPTSVGQVAHHSYDRGCQKTRTEREREKDRSVAALVIVRGSSRQLPAHALLAP